MARRARDVEDGRSRWCWRRGQLGCQGHKRRNNNAQIAGMQVMGGPTSLEGHCAPHPAAAPRHSTAASGLLQVQVCLLDLDAALDVHSSAESSYTL